MSTEGILWEGPSPVDGTPIVAIVTDESRNPKTGPMVQIWILPAAEMPGAARASGRDVAICGSCPQRWALGGGCYVSPMGIASVGRRYLQGGYAKISPWALQGRAVRWGAYGDPAMLPAWLVRAVNSYARTHTGYTHQWREPWAQWSRGIFMASADTPAQAKLARAAGWGSCQVATADGSDAVGLQCAADRIGATCADCGACDGRDAQIWVAAHGAKLRSTVAERRRLRVLKEGT